MQTIQILRVVDPQDTDYDFYTDSEDDAIDEFINGAAAPWIADTGFDDREAWTDLLDRGTAIQLYHIQPTGEGVLQFVLALQSNNPDHDLLTEPRLLNHFLSARAEHRQLLLEQGKDL